MRRAIAVGAAGCRGPFSKMEMERCFMVQAEADTIYFYSFQLAITTTMNGTRHYDSRLRY